jgi:hypothetical protein
MHGCLHRVTLLASGSPSLFGAAVVPCISQFVDFGPCLGSSLLALGAIRAVVMQGFLLLGREEYVLSVVEPAYDRVNWMVE